MILQTEATYLPSGDWQFDIWTRSGHWRVILCPKRAETEDSVTAWGRSVWTDSRHLFYRVGE